MSNFITAADIAALFHALLNVALLVVMVLAGKYVPRLITAFETRTGVEVTAQERMAIMGSIATAAGILKTRLDQGSMRVSDVRPGNAIINSIAADALRRVPDAAASQGTSLEAAIEMIVGAVDTTPPAPAVVVAAAVPPAVSI
jgi:hypothetical protein